MSEEDEIPQWFKDIESGAQATPREQRTVSPEEALPVVLQLVGKMDEINKLAEDHGIDPYSNEYLRVLPRNESTAFVDAIHVPLGLGEDVVVELGDDSLSWQERFGRNFVPPINFPNPIAYGLHISHELDLNTKGKDSDLYGTYFFDRKGRIIRLVGADVKDSRTQVVRNLVIAALYPEHFEAIDHALMILKERLLETGNKEKSSPADPLDNT